MILPAKSRWFESAFTGYMGRLMRRQFCAVQVAGLPVRAVPHSAPLLWLPTHSSWWDGFCDYYLLRTLLKREVYVMMEETELARYRFFTRLGAFSVDRARARDGLRACRLGAELLGHAGRALLLYPQGRLRPAECRPLHLEGGAAWIARRVPECWIVPVAHRYEYQREEKARALVWAGPPFPARPVIHGARSDATAALTATLTASAEALRERILAEEFGEFETVLAGGSPIHHPVERIKRVFSIGQVQRQSRRAG